MVVVIILLFAAGLLLVAHLDSYFFRNKKGKPDEPTSGEDSDKDKPR